MLSIEDMAAFCKRKGFVYPTSEIYGGLSGFFDFGNLGIELKNNIKNQFWKEFVQGRDDIVGIDGSIITNPSVWKASQHTTAFNDFIVNCRKCGHQMRGDHLVEDVLKITAEGKNANDINDIIKEKKIKCEKCKSGELTSAKAFNLMFETNIGPLAGNISYLRPETAQLIFTNFKLVMENNRMKLPFGIAQLGKSFRNEISPRDFLFRMREFEQFEIEFFTDPDKLDDCPYYNEIKNMKLNFGNKKVSIDKLKTSKWHKYWIALFYKWFIDLGINEKNLRVREHTKDELSHYAKACFDIDYKFPFGWKEIYGNADRTQFDLKQHMLFSKSDLTFYDEEKKKKIIPYVASEPSQGIERAMLAFLYDAYNDDKKRGNIVLKLHPKLAPIKVAVFPLVNKLDKEAKEVYSKLAQHFNCFYDRSGSVGRRYARQDEIGTPLCITIDFDTSKDKSVTIRDRDTTKQVRVKIDDLRDILFNLINCETKFSELK